MKMRGSSADVPVHSLRRGGRGRRPLQPGGVGGRSAERTLLLQCSSMEYTFRKTASYFLLSFQHINPEIVYSVLLRW